MERNRIIGGIAAVIVLGALLLVGYHYWWPLVQPTQLPPAAPETVATSTPTAAAPAAQKAKEGKTFVGKTYQQLLTEYKGRRVQITDCTANPTNVTFKNGTTIMLDGFSADPQIITIGSQTVTLHGYDVAFMTLKSTKLPATLTIDCRWLDQPQYNISTILLQS